MKRILFILVLISSIVAEGQNVYRPSNNGYFTPATKPYAPSTPIPTDGRTYKADTINGLFRPYNGTAEILSYLPTGSQYRVGQFPLVVNVGGSLQSNGSFVGGQIQVWWFLRGQADSNLVRMDSTASGTCTTCLLKANNLSDVQSLITTLINLNLNNVDNTSDATKNAATVALTNHTIDANNNTLLHIPNSALTNTSIGLTLNSTGTSPAVTTTPAALGNSLVLSVPFANGTNTGFIRNTDWTLFDLKVDSTLMSNDSVYDYHNGTAIFRYIITGGAGGIASLNGLTASTQTFATGTAGSDFNIASLTATHTFNLPSASASNRGALTSADWSTFNGKQDAIAPSNTIDEYWNGFEAFVPLNTDSVTEGSNHLFYTNTRARAAISLTTTGSSGAATYNSGTGVFNVPNYSGGSGISLTTAATTGPSPTLISSVLNVDTLRYARIFNVQDFATCGDGVRRYTGGINSGSHTFLDATNGNFTSADVGKLFRVYGAGPGGSALTTTISAVTNSTTITLAGSAASSSVFGREYEYGTESGPAIQAAINAADAAGGGTVWIPTGIYFVAQALQDTMGANAQLVIPAHTYQFNFNRPVIYIKGAAMAMFATNFFSGTISAPLQGSAVVSWLQSGNTQTTPAVWGESIETNNFNYTDLQFSNITTLVYTDSGRVAPVLSAYGCRPMGFGGFRRCIAGTDVDVQSTTDPTGANVAGFMASHTSNGGPIILEECVSYGFEYGYILAEHTHLIMPQVFGCVNAYAFPSMAYPVHGTLVMEASRHGIVSPSHDFMGYVHGGGFLDVTIENEIDPDAGPIGPFWYNTVDQVSDTNSQLQGRAYWNNNLYNNTDYSNGVTSVGGGLLGINSAVQKLEFQTFDSTQALWMQGMRFNTQTGLWYQENNVPAATAGLVNGGFLLVTSPAAAGGTTGFSPTHVFYITNDGRINQGSSSNPAAWLSLHAGDATYPSIHLPESSSTAPILNSGDMGWDGANLYFHTRTTLVNLLAPDGGVYVPTLTGTANVSSTTSDTATWIRYGNVIMVTGHITITPTATGTSTTCSISLPVASLLNGGHACWGTASSPQFNTGGNVFSDPWIGTSSGAHAAGIQFVSNTPTGASDFYYHFGYIVQ